MIILLVLVLTLLAVLVHTTLVLGHITLVLVREHTEQVVVVLLRVLGLTTQQTVDLKLAVAGLHLLL